MPAPFNPYQRIMVTTASPETVLIMLYDGAIRNSRQAIESINKSDISGKGMHIRKGLLIVSELMNTLDHKVGGEVAERLEQLYRYVIDEFTNANIHGNVKSLEDALNVLLILRDAWIEAIEALKKERITARIDGGKMMAAG